MNKKLRPGVMQTPKKSSKAKKSMGGSAMAKVMMPTGKKKKQMY